MTTATSTSAPIAAQPTPVAWLQKNLFNGWQNSLLTLVVLAVLLWVLRGFWVWTTQVAQWRVIPANMSLYMVGRYPIDERWRIWLLCGLICGLAGLSWGILSRNAAKLFSRSTVIGIAIACLLAATLPITADSEGNFAYRPFPHAMMLAGIAIVVAFAWVGRQVGRQYPGIGKWVSAAWVLLFPISLWLIGGGFGLQEIGTDLWGGLMLTLLMAMVSIVLCFPIGVLLALGRRSNLPVVRWLCTLYIELIRGVPLIVILFMGQVMIPMFLSEGMRPDRVLRGIIGLTLFSAAYMAENIRGGLQSIPRGQTEASQALGLNPLLTTGLIVLPQALKISVPVIVGQFISLFQDTTLLSIVGLVELLGISRSVLANSEFLGRFREVLLFVGLIFWIFCYAMSLASRQIEKRLNTGHTAGANPSNAVIPTTAGGL
jgi:general L-amino acid transport system permease protein